ncbi:hypothetical protein RB213_005036 [Colletotrichum asianum]
MKNGLRPPQVRIYENSLIK